MLSRRLLLFGAIDLMLIVALALVAPSTLGRLAVAIPLTLLLFAIARIERQAEDAN